MDLNDIYQQIILEHSKSKKNKHEIEDFDYEEPGHNPSCGDEIKIQLQSMRERANNFNLLIYNDLQTVFGIVDQSIIEITGISKKYLEPPSSGSALTEKVVNTIEIPDNINEKHIGS